MPKPNMISGNYNYLGTGGHYKSGLAGLGNVSQGELNNAGLTIGEWQHLMASLNDDAAYGPGGYNTPGLMPASRGLGDPYTIPYVTGNLDTPVGPGMTDYMSSVQAFESSPRPIAINNVSDWLKDNWMMLIAGAGAAMILLPHLGRR